MTPALEKFLWFASSVGVYALSVWPPMLPVRDALVAAAGLAVGAAFFRSVDDRRGSK